MNSNKSTFYAILLWGVVIYAISLLIYCTLRSYSADTKDFISDFGSIIGGIGTFFAAFIAAYLFNDWKDQHNAQVRYNYIKDTLTLLRECIIGLGPTLSSAVVAGEKFINTSSITSIHIDQNLNDKLYEQHKLVYLVFKEYYSIFKDDDSYLEFLKLNTFLEKIFVSLSDLNTTILNIEKLEKITQNTQIVAIPSAISNGRVISHVTVQKSYLDLYRELELHYFNLTSHIATYQINK
ncbi:hypothetical protein MMP65_06080 [Acinetobacter sp. ANC 3926]|uniref:hypothetical protein n=1 Tax=Acinetobacter genomosp. 15BJ TaxID=106651 RepID=UPI001F4ADEF2|nr:hypothetical protein [Acinetobacter genomosp. 15BJ]MCH7291029.1 hypothetical protein [Acinetobacter genomosp. 15BJ]